ncbi:hypothetical protein ACFYNN_35170 [Streptomyces sp. NPDC006978]|uniref:hypothetical protein n=1 Tax=Streptomyces sp. NPDC006978 TaxID=3364769 RepID=UPI0036C9BD5A
MGLPALRAAVAVSTGGSHAGGYWDRHITDVEAHATPVPHELTAPLGQVEQRLAQPADDAPLAALRRCRLR